MYLPEELVMEILSRVQLPSLARLRWASKRWNTLIKDKILSQFIMVVGSKVNLVSFDLHGIHKNVAPSAKVTSQFSLKDSNSSEEVDICNVFHCDGLLLCTTKDNRLVVWNPCSRETRWIQARPGNSYKKTDMFSLGYDNKSSCYKIVWMYNTYCDTFQYIYKYHVYDFTTNSWRYVDWNTGWLIRPWLAQGQDLPRKIRRGMYVKGNTYWLAQGRDHPLLLSFDFSSEKLQCLSLPEDIGSCDVRALSVTRQEQQLCLLATYGKDNIVWMATKIESTRALSWKKLLIATAAPAPYLREFDTGVSFLADREKKVILLYNSTFNNNIHILGEDTYIEVKHHGAAEATQNFHTGFLLGYVPSLVQIQ
ncbi:hypothetical protein CARUB_v10016028mg [Capsella rubella]|uniref:F-box domain-containing protein n=1 Tax=Capsella rubella TaxID=81985 RepID=R0HSD5_9BRAS|nr:putative F-box protein At3g21130 [Capsella rubella]EOA32724.1 hypothetical protein CARUB_v10016028mg [Capsella rubella]